MIQVYLDHAKQGIEFACVLLNILLYKGKRDHQHPGLVPTLLQHCKEQNTSDPHFHVSQTSVFPDEMAVISPVLHVFRLSIATVIGFSSCSLLQTSVNSL